VTSGGGILDFLGGLFGGARANGGPVQAGKFYEVNEKDDELFTQGGRTFLMSSGNGRVDPIKSRGGGTSVNNYFTISSPASRETQEQVAARAYQGTMRAIARGTAG
jgi:hypothetical protein